MKIKYKKFLKVWMLIIAISINCNCALLMMNGSKSVYIRSDIVELKQPVSGSVGFCGIFFSGSERTLYSSRRHHYGNRFIGLHLHNFLYKDFLDTIYGKVTVDCRYDTIKDFSYFCDYYHQKPFLYRPVDGRGAGYITFYDEPDNRGNWRMWSAAVDFFNKYYSCDYYLTGKFYINFSEDSSKKILEIEPTILLILYDNRGYRVWSKLYKKQYYSDEKNQLTPDTTYAFVKKMLNDSKEEINRDLAVINTGNNQEKGDSNN